MEFTEELHSTTELILTAIKEAAGESSISKVQDLSRLLSEAQFITYNFREMEIRLRKLKDEFGALKNNTSTNVEKISFGEPALSSTSSLSAKANAKKVRQKFIDDLKEKGITLNPYKGVTYTNARNNGLVGIAYSCDNGDSWFLGLPDKQYKTVVLLCDSQKSGLKKILLPESFYTKHFPNLSKSNGQMKFNVRIAAGSVQLYTRAGNVSVDEYINNLDVFNNQ